MGNIKNYKQLTVVYLKDGGTLYANGTVQELADHLNEKHFVIIAGKGYQRFDIKNFEPANLDALDQLIESQEDTLKAKLKAKRKRMSENSHREMTIKYAKNFIKNYLNINK